MQEQINVDSVHCDSCNADSFVAELYLQYLYIEDSEVQKNCKYRFGQRKCCLDKW
jgi:hypothetical protein